MKRIFTLVALAIMMALGANAQEAIRKSWDFREGFSTKTINALNADMTEYGVNTHWRNYEGDATKANDQYFFCAGNIADGDGNACTWSADVATPIAELEGLGVPGRKAKKFVIALNAKMGENAGSPNGYHPYGKSFIWFNGKNETMTFKAYCGQEIKIGVESHSNAQDRGIGLTTNAGTLTAVSGDPTPTFFNECVWMLDGDPTELATLTIKSTNGCHIYYIIVGDGVNPEKNDKVAYLYTGDVESEAAYNKIKTNEDIIVVPVDASTATITNETMAEYLTTVISPSVPVEKAADLKAILPYNPVLNLNAAMYTAWGYGETAEVGNIAFLKDNETYSKLPIMKDIEAIVDDSNPEEIVVGLELTTDGSGVMAVKPNEYFAADDTIMYSMDDPTAVMVHQHNMLHNGYIYVPYTEAASESTLQLIYNATNMLISSKSEITAVAKPQINAVYKDRNTNVTMTAVPATLPKPQIFYTTDGTEPTVNSTLYTGVLNFTEATTIKAIATAEGYNQSEVATFDVEIFDQPATPSISFTANGATSEVTIACVTEGADIWYNFTGSNDTTQSMKYVAPFVLKENTNVTAFSETLDKVYSELAEKRVLIKDPIVRVDQIVHFNSQLEGFSNNTYMFGMKNGLSIYDDMGDIEGVDEEGNPIFPMRKDSVYVVAPDNNFAVKSNGQELIYQVLSIGKDPGNGEGYNPATAADVSDLITKNCIQFGKKIGDEPFTGRIETTNKYQAPFNMLAFIGTASGSKAQMIFQVSADGENWKDANTDTIFVNNIKRLWSKYTVSYEGTDEVYVRLKQVGGSSGAQVYDIYLLTEGEQSAVIKEEMKKEWDEYTSTLGDVNNDGLVAVDDVVMTINAALGDVAEDLVFEAADMNSDGQILVDDVVRVINAVLGISESKQHGVKAVAENAAGDQFYLQDFTITAGETKQVAIQFESDKVSTADPAQLEYVAFQFDIYMPEGLTITQSKGKYAFTFNEDRKDDHTFTSAVQADGSIRVLSASLTNASFWETQGDFVKFNVQAAEGFKGGKIALKKVMFSTKAGNRTELTDVEAFVSETTGIDGITTVDNINGDVYSVTGQLVKKNATTVKGLAKGVYVVNGKKVLVK